MSSTTAPLTASAPGEQIERYTFGARLCHWLVGFSYLYCLATGLAFYTPYLFWIAIALGGGPASRFWHPIIGVAFSAGVLWMHSLWRREMPLSAGDRQWLRQANAYAANRDELLPAQDKFNAGQKLFYWAMFWGALVLLVSGVVMWFPELVPYSLRPLRSFFVLLHEVAALITIGAFIIHVYMGVFMEPESLKAIVRGYVSKEWARAYHRLWYERMAAKPSPRATPSSRE